MRNRSIADYTVLPKARKQLSVILEPVILGGLILTLWLATHPYMGVIHDARLYLIQTLHLMDPTRWKGDLFFRYGTQDSYSIFSNGYRFLVSSLGISRSDQVALFAGSMLWLAGLNTLIRTILKRPHEQIAAACGVIAFSSSYGGFNVFHYAEPFVTPRLFAEAAIITSLAFAAKGRYIWTAILVLFAFLVHPLMAIPGIGIVVVHFVRQHRWARIALGLFLIASVACIGLATGPFARAREFYDTTWFQIVAQRNGVAMISMWSAADHARVVAAFLSLTTFLTVATDREKKYIISLLVAAILSCIASLLGADLTHNVLITNLQLWRVMWLVGLASNAAILLLFLRTTGTDRSAITIAATFSFLPQFFLGLSLVAPFLVILCLLWVLRKKISNIRVRFLASCMILISTAITLVGVAIAFQVQIVSDRFISEHVSSLILAAIALFGLGLAARHQPSKWLIPVVMVMLASGIAQLDQQTPWNRYVYGSGPDRGLSEFLANSGETYWEGTGVEALWFKARKPSYYSRVQGSESIFFRAEALEWWRRKSALEGIDTATLNSKTSGKNGNQESNSLAARLHVVSACKELPELDTIILNHSIVGLPQRKWTAPTYQNIVEPGTITEGHDRKGIARISTFYRYDCANFRNQ